MDETMLKQLWDLFIRVPPGYKREVACDTLQNPNAPSIRKWISSFEEFLEFMKTAKGKAIYVGVFAHGADGKIVGDLVFDIDDKTSLENSYSDFIRLCEGLVSGIGIDERAIWASFSGQKGFHVRIPLCAIVKNPADFQRNDLHEIFKEIAKDIQGKIKSIDTQIYDARRVWRLENTLHPISNLFCVPLPPLSWKLPLQNIIELAQKPQPILWQPAQYKENMIETRMIEIMEEKAEETLARRNGIVKIRREDVDVDWMERPCIKSLVETAEQTGEIPHMGRLQIVTLAGDANDYEKVHEIMQKCKDYQQKITDYYIKKDREKTERKHISCEVMRTDVFQEVNKDRVTAGLKPLEENEFCNPDACPFIQNEIKLQDINARYYGRRCVANVLISGIGDSFIIPIGGAVFCGGGKKECQACPNATEGISGGIRLHEQVELVGRNEQTQKKAAAEFILQHQKNIKNRECFLREVRAGHFRASFNMGTLTEIFAMDAVRYLDLSEMKKTNAPRMVRMYTAGTPPSAGIKAIVRGTVGKTWQDGRLVFVAHSVEKATDDLESFVLDDNTKSNLEKIRKMGVSKLIEKTMQFVDLIERENWIVTILLTACSPLYISWRGKPLATWLCTTCYGGTRTGKSKAAKDLIMNLGIGIYVVSEVSGRTGLLYTIAQTSRGYVVLWGDLPFSDRTLVVLDGTTKLESEEMNEFREARVSGILSVRKAARADALVRVRLIMIENPREGESIKNYLYPIMVLSSHYETPDLARIDIPVYVREVEAEKILSRKKKKTNNNNEELIPLLRTLILYAWTRKAEDIIITPAAEKEIIKQAKALVEEFYCDTIPIIASDVEKKAAAISAAWAILSMSTDESMEKVIITPGVAKQAMEWYREVLRENELDQYAAYRKRQCEIQPEEIAEIQNLFQEKPILYEILSHIAREGAVQRQVLSEYTGIGKTGLDEYIPILKEKRLIVTKRDGYRLTPRGIQVYKEIMKKTIANTNDTNNTTKNSTPYPPGGGRGDGGVPSQRCVDWVNCVKNEDIEENREFFNQKLTSSCQYIFKDICGFCFASHFSLREGVDVERMGKVSEGICQECHSRPAEVRIRIKWR
jgi:hypothetical protein